MRPAIGRQTCHRIPGASIEPHVPGGRHLLKNQLVPEIKHLARYIRSFFLARFTPSYTKIQHPLRIPTFQLRPLDGRSAVKLHKLSLVAAFWPFALQCSCW
jgi:hypothetical protein